MRAFLRIVLFTVAGPFVGLLAMAVLIGSYTLATTGSTRDFAIGPELFAPGILLVAYTLGGLPALLTGIVASLLARAIAGWRYWLLIALAGGLISLAGAVVAIGGGPEMIGVREQPQLVVLMTLAGAIAGILCAMLFDGLSSLLRRDRAR
ncbi:MAG: hypothetical protein ABIY37_05005 [Devosia sp.]